jgi:hypothetical protein
MDVRRITDENTYMENFRHLRCGYEERLIFDLIDWLRRNHFKINWETNDRNRSEPRMQLTIVAQHNGKEHSNANVVTDGKVRVHTRDRKLPFDSMAKRVELVKRFSQVIPGTRLMPSSWKDKIERGNNVAPYFELKEFGMKEVTNLHDYLIWYRDQITSK